MHIILYIFIYPSWDISLVRCLADIVRTYITPGIYVRHISFSFQLWKIYIELPCTYRPENLIQWCCSTLKELFWIIKKALRLLSTLLSRSVFDAELLCSQPFPYHHPFPNYICRFLCQIFIWELNMAFAGFCWRSRGDQFECNFFFFILNRII